MIFADGNVLHLGRNDASTSVGELGYSLARSRYEGVIFDVLEAEVIETFVGTALTTILRRKSLQSAGILTPLDPFGTQLGQALMGVGSVVGIGVGPRGVVHYYRLVLYGVALLVYRGREVYAAHGYTDIFELLTGYVDLGTAGQCPCGDGEVFGLVFCSHFYLFMRFDCFCYLYDWRR